MLSSYPTADLQRGRVGLVPDDLAAAVPIAPPAMDDGGQLTRVRPVGRERGEKGERLEATHWSTVVWAVAVAAEVAEMD